MASGLTSGTRRASDAAFRRERIFSAIEMIEASFAV
jgi:hypothetical protein